MPLRRHHNNKGYRQIKRGKLQRDAEVLGRKLGIPVRPGKNRLRRLIEELNKNVETKEI